MRGILVCILLLVPGACAYHPPWQPVAWYGHADDAALWASRDEMDDQATQASVSRSVTVYAASQADAPGEGRVVWRMEVQRDENETLALSAGGNLTIDVYFSANSGNVEGTALPATGDVGLTARLLLDGATIVQTPVQEFEAGAGWDHVFWHLINPISAVLPEQSFILEVVAAGPATGYHLGLSPTTGRSHITLPVVVPPTLPQSEWTRAVALGWRANVSLQHSDAVTFMHTVDWTGPARVRFDAHVQADAGAAAVVVTDPSGRELRRGGSVSATILEGVAGAWNITIVGSQFIGNVSWSMADLAGPPPPSVTLPPPPPPPGPPLVSTTPPLPDPEPVLDDVPEDKEASLSSAWTLLALLVGRRPARALAAWWTTRP